MVLSPSPLTPTRISPDKVKGDQSGHTTPTYPQHFSPGLRPSRPHSISVSSVHFADTLPDRLTDDPAQSPTRSVSHPILRTNGDDLTPPTTPALTPRQTVHPADGKQGSSSRPLLHGKRASIVTGGYESSSTEDEPTLPNHHRHASYQIQNVKEESTSSRPRARSLMFPISTPPIGRSSSDKSLQRENKPSRLSSSRHSSRDILRSSFRQPVLPPTSSVPSRSPSNSSKPSVPGPSASRPGTDRPSPDKRTLRKDDPSPSRLRQDAASPASSRSRKGKERAEPRRDLLASSLGLGAGGGGIALTADQINDLLADSDVGAAIRSMGAPYTPSIPQPRSPLTSRPTSPEIRQPYLASAPPPIVTSPTHRERTISISTTASSPRQPRRSSSIPNADVLARRRRASSRGTLGPEGDGGHVPFTHHVPPPTAIESEEEEDVEQEETESAIELPKSDAVDVENGLKPEKKGKRKRITMLFGLKHKRSISSSLAEPLVDIPLDRDKEKQKKGFEAKEKERQAKEADMRDKERQRRNDEIEEDRYFRALQQVSAHPHSVDLADQAKLHLWAHYQHVFEGLEDPPRFNPVAILRWKHKVEEQESARKAWDSRNKHLGASVDSLSSSTSTSAGSRRKNVLAGGGLARWAYTMDDIDRYKDTKGHVDYFIPPRQPPGESLPRVNELTALEHPDNEGGSTKGSIIMQEDVHVHPQQQGRAVSNPSSTNLLRREDSRQSFEPLSRSPSNDRPGKISHRAHQSLGHIGPSAIGHALKAPFDKLGSIARRQLTLPPGDISDSTIDESPLRPLRNPTSPTDRPYHDLSHGQSTGIGPGLRHRTADRLFHRQKPDSAATDDETKEHRRRLFLKGDRTRGRRADTGGMMDGDRQAELVVLEAAIQREARWREQQDAVGKRTKAEEEARKRLKEVEGAIYTERSRKLSEARGGVYRMDAALIIVEDNIKHYLAQMGQIRQSALITTGLDLDTGQRISKQSVSTHPDINRSPDNPTSPTFATPTHARNGHSPNNPPQPPSRSNTSQDRSNRDRLFLASSKLMQTQHALQGLEDGRADTARQLGVMVDELRATLRRRDEVDKWSKRTMNEIDVLRDRRNRLQSRFDDIIPWYKSRRLDPVFNWTVRAIATPVFIVYTPVKNAIYYLAVCPINLVLSGIMLLARRRSVRGLQEDEWVRVGWTRHFVERVLILGVLVVVGVGILVWLDGSVRDDAPAGKVVL